MTRSPSGHAGAKSYANDRWPVQLLTLSARSPADLNRAIVRLSGCLETRPDLDLAEVARALHVDRPALAHRAVVTVRDRQNAIERLRRRDDQHLFVCRASQERSVVFMFSGVGEQYPGLAWGLYQHLLPFRSELDRCCEQLQSEQGTDLRAVLYPQGVERQRGTGREGRLDLATLFDRHSPAAEIHSTSVAQPLMFALQYAVARLLMGVGVEPAAMVGYSVGEYVAASLAGVLSAPEALRLVAARARLAADVSDGAMLAVMSDVPSFAGSLGDELAVAAIDGPTLSVVAGRAAAVGELERRLLDDGVACRRLPTSHAFHSPMMAPLVAPLEAMLASADLQPPRRPFLSNLTGTWIRPDEATSPRYWAEHMQRTIRFSDNLAELWRLRRPILVQLGPGRMLSSLAFQHPGRPADGSGLILRTLPGAFERNVDVEVLLATVGRLWAAGIAIDWSALYSGRLVPGIAAQINECMDAG